MDNQWLIHKSYLAGDPIVERFGRLDRRVRAGMMLGLAVLLWIVTDIARRHPESCCLAEEESAVMVVRDTQLNETIYRSTMSGCVVEWCVRDAEPAVVRQHTRCLTPLEEQLPLMFAVGNAFFRQAPNAQALQTLFWGRLAPDGTREGAQEMSFRLALAAFQSPGWDRSHGRPHGGDINGFVRLLADEAMIYPELKALFARFGRDLTLSAVEKVLVMRADRLPYFDRLQPYGVRPFDKLPFDGLTWFVVLKQ